MTVPYFCCLFVSEIYFWKYSRNALGFFEDFLYAKTKSQSEGELERRPRGQVRPPTAGQGGPVGGALPCPWDLTSRPSDAYKIVPDAKTLTPGGFYEIRYRAPPGAKPSFGVKLFLFRHPAGTGIDRRSHLHRHRCFLR